MAAETPAPIWSPPELLEGFNAGAARYPHIAVYPGGRAQAIWSQSNGTASNLWSSAYLPGSGWAGAELLAQGAGGVHHADLAFDSSGVAQLLVVDSGSPENLWWRTYNGSSGWSPPVWVNNGTGYSMDIEVVGDATGNMTAVFDTWYSRDMAVEAMRRAAGGEWGALKNLSRRTTDYFMESSAAADAGGNVIVLAQNSDNRSFRVVAHWYEPVWGWRLEQVLDDGHWGNATMPAVSMDPYGNATAVWARGNYREQASVVAARFNPVTTGWTTPVVIEAAVSGLHYPKVASDPAGGAVAIWNRTVGGHNDLVAARFDPVTGWAMPQSIESLPGMVDHPQIGVDAAGNYSVVWRRSDGERSSVWSARYNATSGWSQPVLIEPFNEGDAHEPELAVAADGAATAIWIQNNGISDSVLAARYDPSTGWQAPAWLEWQDAAVAADPQVFSDASGRALAVWRQSDGSYGFKAWASTRIPGGNWSVPILLSGILWGSSSTPRLVASMNSRGEAIVGWTQPIRDNYRANLLAKRFSFEEGWSRTEQVSDTKGGVNSWSVAIDDWGTVFAAWEQDPSPSARARVFAPDRGWGAEAVLEPSLTNESSYGIHVAASGGGTAIASWTHIVHANATSSYSCRATRYNPTSGWATPTEIVSAPQYTGPPPLLAADALGNAIFVWRDYRFGDVGLSLVEWAMNGSLSPIRFFARSASGSGYLQAPAVAVAPDGRAFVSWITLGERNVSWAAERTSGGVWLDAVPLAEPENGWVAPGALAMDAQGRAVAGWVEWNASGGSIVTRRFEPGSGWGVREVLAGPLRPLETPSLAMDGQGNSIAVWIAQDGFVASVYGSMAWIRPPCAGLWLERTGGGLTNHFSVVVAGVAPVGASLTVDGSAVAVQPDGSFEVTLSLAEGAHSLPVVAREPMGGVCEARFVVAVDTTAPELVVDFPPPGFGTEAATVLVAGRTDPGSAVKVNGQTVAVDENGSFAFEIGLASGRNEITVAAYDQAGNSAELSIAGNRVSTLSAIELGVSGWVALLSLGAAGAAAAAAISLRRRRRRLVGRMDAEAPDQ